MITERCQECVDLYPGAPCPKHAVPLPEPEVVKMYCDHGQVPPGGCKTCYDNDPYNWVPRPSWAKRTIIPLTEKMKWQKS